MATKAAVAILVDAEAVRRSCGDAVREAAVEVAKFFAFGRGATAPKQNEVSLYVFNTAESRNDLHEADPANGRDVVCDLRLQKPSRRLFELLARPGDAWPEGGGYGAVDAIIAAVHEIAERTKQLKYARRIFVVSDDRGALAPPEDADAYAAAVGDFKQTLNYAIKDQHYGFHAILVEGGGGGPPPEHAAAAWLDKASKISLKAHGEGSFVAAPGEAAGLAAAEACGALVTPTRASKIQLRVLSLAVDLQQWSFLKDCKNPTLSKEAAETGGKVTTETIYRVEGVEDDKDKEDIVMGYVYGGEFLPLDRDHMANIAARHADEDDAGAACRVLGFARAAEHDALHSLGDARCLEAVDGDARGAAFLGALCRALAGADRVAVARWRNTARSSSEDLHVLRPFRDGSPRLAAHRVAFADDLRSTAGLDPLPAPDPTLKRAALALVESHALDAAATQRLLVTNHPTVLSVQDLVVSRLLSGPQAAPDAEAGLLRRKKARFAKLAEPPRRDDSAPDDDAASSWKAELKAALAAAEAKNGAQTTRRERWVAAAAGDAAAVDETAAATAGPARVAIDKQNAVADFKRQLAEADSERAEALRACMEAAIIDIAEASEMGAQYLAEARDCLAALRDASGPDRDASAPARFDAFLENAVREKRDELPDFDDILRGDPAARPFAEEAPADAPAAAPAPPPEAAPMDVQEDEDEDFE